MTDSHQQDNSINGRWTQEEHEMFLYGNKSSYFRPLALWQELEENTRNHQDQDSHSSSLSCSKILLKN